MDLNCDTEWEMQLRNPKKCNAWKHLENHPGTPFLGFFGRYTGIQIVRIERSMAADKGKSPWTLKMLGKRNIESGSFKKKLLQEAKLLKTFNHPNIVGYRASGKKKVAQICYMLMYTSTSLGYILQQRFTTGLGPLEVRKSLMVTLEVLKGLAYLHNKELTLHGDLKSLNILIKNDFERVQICGFDASRILMPNGFLDLVTNPIAMYGGTALWSAPEVFFQDSRLISVKTDIFALGLVIYEMLVLVPPHTFPGMIDECVSASTMYSAKRNIVFPSSSQLNREDVIIQDFGEAERMEVFYDMGIPTNLNQDEKELPLHMVVARKRAAPRVDPDIVTIDSSDDDVKVYNQGEVLNIISDDDEDEIFSYSDSESDEDCDDEEHWESSSLSGEDVVDTDEMMESDEEDEEDGPYLNYGCLGTRPPIPSEITLGEEYATMLELFFVCTNSNKDERPSALTLLFGLKNYVPKRDPNLTGMNP